MRYFHPEPNTTIRPMPSDLIFLLPVPLRVNSFFSTSLQNGGRNAKGECYIPVVPVPVDLRLALGLTGRSR